jgi:transposase
VKTRQAKRYCILTSQPADPATSSKRPKKSAEQVELEKLRHRNAKLEADLTKTRLALDIMGKAHALLEELSESAENNEPPTTS